MPFPKGNRFRAYLQMMSSFLNRLTLRLPMRPPGFPCSSAGKESACNVGDPALIPGLGRSPGERIDYPFQYSWASLVAQTVKNLPAMLENLNSITGLGRSPGGRHGSSLQYSCLENLIDRGTWWTADHWVAESATTEVTEDARMCCL